jgi:hypothetical protein
MKTDHAAEAARLAAGSPVGARATSRALLALVDVLTELLEEVRSLSREQSRPAVSCGGCSSSTRHPSGTCDSCRLPVRSAS